MRAWQHVHQHNTSGSNAAMQRNACSCCKGTMQHLLLRRHQAPHSPARYSSSVLTSFFPLLADPAALSRPEAAEASLEAAPLPTEDPPLPPPPPPPPPPLELLPALPWRRIWLFRFLAAAASCSFCSCAAVLGGVAVVMAVLATLLHTRAGRQAGGPGR